MPALSGLWSKLPRPREAFLGGSKSHGSEFPFGVRTSAGQVAQPPSARVSSRTSDIAKRTNLFGATPLTLRRYSQRSAAPSL